MPDRDPQADLRRGIKRQRRTLGLTQAQAATLIGLKRISYHRMESGAQRVRLEDLIRICETYGCTVDDLAPNSEAAATYRRMAERLIKTCPAH